VWRATVISFDQFGALTTVEADITEEDIETEDIETEDIETEDALQSSPGPWVLIINGWLRQAGCPVQLYNRTRERLPLSSSPVNFKTNWQPAHCQRGMN